MIYDGDSGGTELELDREAAEVVKALDTEGNCRADGRKHDQADCSDISEYRPAAVRGNVRRVVMGFVVVLSIGLQTKISLADGPPTGSLADKLAPA